jgi:hypothetical protein
MNKQRGACIFLHAVLSFSIMAVVVLGFSQSAGAQTFTVTQFGA